MFNGDTNQKLFALASTVSFHVLTSWWENNFNITDPLWGESTGHGSSVKRGFDDFYVEQPLNK